MDKPVSKYCLERVHRILGYLKMRRGVNSCGIANNALVFLVMLNVQY
jgi:hypothetical protein